MVMVSPDDDTYGGKLEGYRLYKDGRNAMARGEITDAIALLLKAASLEPHAKTYQVLGECLLQDGKLLDAILYLAASAGLGSRESRSHYLLAQALIRLGNDHLVDAAQQLQRAIELNPSYKSARDLLEELSSKYVTVRDWLSGR
jgi:tetratricopeptide (TPR) repeat protein